MAAQVFSVAQREAIWVAYDGKCAYTRQLIDISNFHIDHVLPESLADDSPKLAETLSKLRLPSTFDIFGYQNLVPCQPGANLQKGATVFDPAHIHYFLGVASAKVDAIQENLIRIEKRKNRGRALILLQQALERGELKVEEVIDILLKYTEQPSEIFSLLEGMWFADSDEIRLVARSELDALRDRRIKLGQNDQVDCVTLINEAGEERHVRTCREYDAALATGFCAATNFDIKMSAWFENQCSLLKALESASLPLISYIASPRVSILDLNLLPFSFFPQFRENGPDSEVDATYQSKIDDGSLVIKRVGNNVLQVEEPKGMGQQLIEVVRADFNGDGMEDILLFEYCYATHGTLGYSGVRVITRQTKDGKFALCAP